MKKSWQLQSLGTLCGFVRGPFGGSLKKSIFKPSGFAVYEQQHAIYDQFTEVRYFVDENKFEEMRRFELLPGDLIMSCSGTMGKVAIVPDGIKQGIINQALLKLTPTESILVEFLRYWMGSPGFQDELSRQSQGVAIKNVASVKVLKEIQIPLPPLPEQKRIVAILDEAFAGIDAAVANTEKNLANARELLESYLNAVFTQKGDGWNKHRLGSNVYRLTNGYVGATRDIYKENGVPYLLARHVKKNVLTFDGRTYISSEFNIKNKKSILKTGDVLLVQSGHIGHSAVVPESHAGHNCHAMIVITPKENLLGDFLSLFFNTPMMQGKFQEIRSGSTVPHLTCKAVKELEIPIPSHQEQRAIFSQCQMFAEETQRLESICQQKLEALAELKQSLLQKAFAGELTTLPDKTLKEAVA